MLTAFLIISLILGVFMSYAWKSTDWVNLTIKVLFTLYTLWATALVSAVLLPSIKPNEVHLGSK